MQEPISHTPPTVEKDATPVFLFVCKDGPDGPAVRVKHLKGHLAHVEANWQRYIIAGPMRRPGETALCGSYFLLRAANVDEAWNIMRGDPYVTSDLYADIEVTDIVPAIGLWIGGKIWADAAALADRATGG